MTRAVSKQLLPVYDKPLIYYPLSMALLAGCRDVLVITTPQDEANFVRLLGDGSQWGAALTYASQPSPDGLAQAFLIGETHLAGGDAALILGDNLFFGHGMRGMLTDTVAELTRDRGCTLFGYRVHDPGRYGVAVLEDRRLIDIEEKPAKPKTDLAITGMYFYDNQVVEIAKSLRPSARGELEITDLNKVYIEQGQARLKDLGRGTAWLDTGTHDSLMEAGQFVQVLQHRQGITIACLEEIAMRQGWISPGDAIEQAEQMGKSSYATYLKRTAVEFAERGV